MGRIVDENGFLIDGDWEEPETEHDEWLEEECRHPYEQYRESGACKYTDCRECDYQNVCDEWVE